MNYKIYFGHFGIKRGYLVVSNNKHDFLEIYPNIDFLLKTIRHKDIEAHISLDFLDQKEIEA